MTGSTPSITPAQIVAVVTAVAGLLVDGQWVSGHVMHLVVGLAAILVPFGLVLADAIIRHGRSRALTPVATATVQVTPKDTPPPPAV